MKQHLGMLVSGGGLAIYCAASATEWEERSLWPVRTGQAPKLHIGLNRAGLAGGCLV